jgi:uncharacterized protein YndB with AHSA1/START domain
MSRTKIKIEAVIAGPASQVWEAWTNPAHITQWNFASDDWCCPSATNDLKVGGRYCARMEAKDGSFGFDFEAIYDEILAFEKLAMTLGDGRSVTTTFEPNGKTTKVTTVFEAEEENPVAMQRDGWQAILNNFKKYVEAH